MIRIACVAGVVLALISPIGGAEQPPAAAEVARYAQAQIAEHFPADKPGLALLVARGDALLYRGARGLASVELGVPLSPDHVFRIGSVTKQFAAAALLKLVDEGKIALGDPLSKFLPDYPDGENITVAQLLNHTSGIQSYTSIPGYMDQDVRRDLSTSELIAVFKDKPAEFAPGERWNYNNSGYVLVGAVIEQASGMAWDRWLARSLFEPLDLSHTRSGATRRVIAMRADGYSMTDAGDVSTAAPLSMTQPHAAGALVSTLDDLWRWNRALHGGRVISAESYRRMITPEGQAGEAPNRYGYGIGVGSLRGRTIYEHGGGIHGFLSLLIYMSEGEITVAALRNADGSGGREMGMVARKVAAFALGDPYPDAVPVEVPESELRKLEGVYRLDEDEARTLRVAEGVLTSQRTGGPVTTLIPIGDDTFLFQGSLNRFTIERDADGTPKAMRFFPDGEGEGELWKRVD